MNALSVTTKSLEDFLSDYGTHLGALSCGNYGDFDPGAAAADCMIITLPFEIDGLPVIDLSDQGPGTFIIPASYLLGRCEAFIPGAGDILISVQSSSKERLIMDGNGIPIPFDTYQKTPPLPIAALPSNYLRILNSSHERLEGELFYQFVNLCTKDSEALRQAPFVAVEGANCTTLATKGHRLWFLDFSGPTPVAIKGDC